MTAGGDPIRAMDAFLDEVVYPAEEPFAAQGGVNEPNRQVLGRVIDEAKDRGLWNLFSSVHPSASDRSQADLFALAELAGRSPVLAQVGLHSLNPDAGVMELLLRAGTQQQQDRWLGPLAAGETSSAFCITEPGIASSDPTATLTSAVDDPARAGGMLLSGTKSWCTGALDPRCDVMVVLAMTEPDVEPGRQHSLVLTTRSDAGVHVGRNRTVYGYSDIYRGGHPDVEFSQARAEILGERGQGLATAQLLLSPARVVHCMRLVGTAERALELLCLRLSERTSRGRSLSANDLWVDRVAECRIRIESLRGLVRSLMARASDPVVVSLLKAEVPGQVARIVDLAIQAHGSDGFSQVAVLADLYANARSLQISDGPDEVHRRVVGRAEFKRYQHVS